MDGVEGVDGAEEGAGGAEDGKRKVGEGWWLFCSEFFEAGEVEEGGDVAEVEEGVDGDAGKELGEEAGESRKVNEVKRVDDAEHDYGFDEEGERLLEVLADWEFFAEEEVV
ncbi:hypothetical protein IKL45_03640 [Candidatus Saccharibacteria bacterium]|nr:hypothetical protein [Candidatus Saccharibacteria bacterium]